MRAALLFTVTCLMMFSSGYGFVDEQQALTTLNNVTNATNVTNEGAIIVAEKSEFTEDAFLVEGRFSQGEGDHEEEFSEGSEGGSEGEHSDGEHSDGEHSEGSEGGSEGEHSEGSEGEHSEGSDGEHSEGSEGDSEGENSEGSEGEHWNGSEGGSEGEHSDGEENHDGEEGEENHEGEDEDIETKPLLTFIRFDNVSRHMSVREYFYNDSFINIWSLECFLDENNCIQTNYTVDPFMSAKHLNETTAI